MLLEIMKHLRNFFTRGRALEGSFQVENGTISLLSVPTNAYILIEGSLFNDGVYKYPPTGLKTETFDGAISTLFIPAEFLDLVEEIETWQEEHAKPIEFQSESFDGYSYSRVAGKNGNTQTWSDVFRNRLNAWRKI